MMRGVDKSKVVDLESSIAGEGIVIPKIFHRNLFEDYLYIEGYYVVKREHKEFHYLSAMPPEEFSILNSRKCLSTGDVYTTQIMVTLHGNLAIPLDPDFKAFAYIYTDLYVMGAGYGFEIWSPEQFVHCQLSSREGFEDGRARVKELIRIWN